MGNKRVHRPPAVQYYRSPRSPLGRTQRKTLPRRSRQNSDAMCKIHARAPRGVERGSAMQEARPGARPAVNRVHGHSLGCVRLAVLPSASRDHAAARSRPRVISGNGNEINGRQKIDSVNHKLQRTRPRNEKRKTEMETSSSYLTRWARSPVGVDCMSTAAQPGRLPSISVCAGPPCTNP